MHIQASLPRGGSTAGTSQHTAIVTKAITFGFLMSPAQPHRMAETEITLPLVKAGLPVHICKMGLKVYIKTEGNEGDNKLLRLLHDLYLCGSLHSMYLGNK